MRTTLRLHQILGCVAILVLLVLGGGDGAFARPASTTGAVRALPAAPQVFVSFTFTATHRRATLLRLARNRIAFRQTKGGRLLMAVGRGRHELVSTRAGRRVPVRLTLDFARNRLTATAGRRRVVVKRRLVRGDRVVVGAHARGIRGLRITSGELTPQPTASPAPPPASPAPAAPPAAGLPRLFSSTSAWNAPLPDNAPLDPASGRLVQTLRNTVAANLAARTGPWIQSADSSTPIYRVPAGQPMVPVKLDEGAWATSLQSALQNVPIPPDAWPAAGSDGHLTIWQASTDRLWELFKARRLADGWHASFGGAMANVSANPGYYTSDSWPGAGSFWGATATSLPAAAGMMRIDELQSGVIPHALAIAVPFALPRVYAWPAQRTDGTSTDPEAIPEGARFQIDPSVNLDALSMPPMTRMMAEAVQRYGMIVRDQTAHSVTFYAEDPTPTGTNPYLALYGNQYPIDLLASFPWAYLRLVKMDLRGG